jgi:hypothetical protein
VVSPVYLHGLFMDNLECGPYQVAASAGSSLENQTALRNQFITFFGTV